MFTCTKTNKKLVIWTGQHVCSSAMFYCFTLLYDDVSVSYSVKVSKFLFVLVLVRHYLRLHFIASCFLSCSCKVVLTILFLSKMFVMKNINIPNVIILTLGFSVYLQNAYTPICHVDRLLMGISWYSRKLSLVSNLCTNIMVGKHTVLNLYQTLNALQI